MKGILIIPLALLPLILASAVPLNKFGFGPQTNDIAPHHHDANTFFWNPFSSFFSPNPQQNADSASNKQLGLTEGFYSQSCPQAERVVNDIANEFFRKDPSLAASIIRLLSHDCLVQGCDASILLDKMPNGEAVEKQTRQNEKYIRGYQVIDEIKQRLEFICPGTVSCADIIVFIARDSVVHTGGPEYQVRGGRRDGLSSLAKNVNGSLAYPDTPPQEIINIFQGKGFSLEELVLLLGSHSVGNAHCYLIADRFQDPKKTKEMDPGFVTKMQTLTMCQNEMQLVAIDPYSSHKMDSRFYDVLLKNRAVIESDHSLAKLPQVRKIMEKYVNDQEGWMARFVETMIKLGELQVLTGNQGEIRKQCRAIN